MKTKFTMVKWPSDPVTSPKGEHTLWWVDWYFSVVAQPWLRCEAASLPFSFQCMIVERSRTGAHHTVCTEELCFGTDKTMNPLRKGLARGRTACHPVKQVSNGYFLQRRNGVNAFLDGQHLFEPRLWGGKPPTPDFKKDSTRSILSLKQTPEDNRQ